MLDGSNSVGGKLPFLRVENRGKYSCGAKYLELNHEDETKLAEFSKTISP